jgi:esterase/lipase
MAADIELRKTTPKEFYKFFVESEIFKTLKKIKESTFEELRDELMNYESQIDELLSTVNERYNDIDEKVDRILKLFYFNVVNWKNDKIESYIYPMGVNNPLFQYFQTKDKDNYLNTSRLPCSSLPIPRRQQLIE